MEQCCVHGAHNEQPPVLRQGSMQLPRQVQVSYSRTGNVSRRPQAVSQGGRVAC